MVVLTTTHSDSLDTGVYLAGKEHCLVFGTACSGWDLESALISACELNMVDGIAMNDVVEFSPTATPGLGRSKWKQLHS